jgi:hypothetical protein
MYYTVYKITNLINNKYYIGKHQTTNLNDGYMGSGKLIKQAILKNGIENFKKEILFIFDNEIDMNFKEAELVVISEDTYNLCAGGHGGFSYINNSGIDKFRGKTHTEETKKKILESRKDYTHSDETKLKMSKDQNIISKRNEIVNQVIMDLGLKEVADSLIGENEWKRGLSGGN